MRARGAAQERAHAHAGELRVRERVAPAARWGHAQPAHVGGLVQQVQAEGQVATMVLQPGAKEPLRFLLRF